MIKLIYLIQLSTTTLVFLYVKSPSLSPFVLPFKINILLHLYISLFVYLYIFNLINQHVIEIHMWQYTIYNIYIIYALSLVTVQLTGRSHTFIYNDNKSTSFLKITFIFRFNFYRNRAIQFHIDITECVQNVIQMNSVMNFTIF